jgi:hypothetical protein
VPRLQNTAIDLRFVLPCQLYDRMNRRRLTSKASLLKYAAMLLMISAADSRRARSLGELTGSLDSPVMVVSLYH